VANELAVVVVTAHDLVGALLDGADGGLGVADGDLGVKFCIGADATEGETSAGAAIAVGAGSVIAAAGADVVVVSVELVSMSGSSPLPPLSPLSRQRVSNSRSCRHWHCWKSPR
jgi:hypothetical protein